jgi:ATP-dependent RNA helicase DDX51/DBP6
VILRASFVGRWTDRSLARTVDMAPYARYVPLKAAAPVAAATTTPEHVAVPSKAKQVKVPKGPSRSDDSGRKKRKRAELDDPSTTPAAPADDDDTPAVPSKHSAVYSKFQKAAQRSEAAKATAPDDQVDLDHQPELHGMRQPCLALVCASKPDRRV